MLPTKAVRLQFGALLAADPTTLAPAANANTIALVQSNFVPNENLTIASFTLASFTGSTPINVPLGAQGVGDDPITLEQFITMLAPAGGWRWVCTGAPASPQTIYGFVLTTKAQALLLAMALFVNPITIQFVNDQIDLGAVQIQMVLQPAS